MQHGREGGVAAAAGQPVEAACLAGTECVACVRRTTYFVRLRASLEAERADGVSVCGAMGRCWFWAR
jgi:hypothetical protein